MAGTVRELRANFTGAFGGLRQTIRGVQREIQGISGVTRSTVRDSNREFGRMEDVMERLPEHLQGFGQELQNTRKEMKRTAREGTRSLDEMAEAATKSSVAMSKITSVTKTGKSAIKTIQGLSDATKETQLAILGLNRNGTVKISTEETTRRLAQFKDELADSKRQLEALRDAGDFGSYETGMRVVEQKLRDVDRAMYAAAQGGQAYTNMINQLGVNTSDAANQAAIQMEAYKDQFIRSVDLMNAKSNQSKKMMDILPEVSHLQSADRFFLGIGNRLEDIAKKGSAASIALRMLGRDASMKDLNDRIMLINQGLMRMNMLGMGMGIAFGGFTVGMIKLSNAVDGRLVPAADKFKDTWGEALKPFAQMWTDFALMVVNAGTKVGEFVQKVNELNPAISEMAGMFMYLFTGLSVILAPMAIGIGRAEGMRAAFTAMFTMVKPFVLGFLRIAAMASVVAGAMVIVGGVFIKLWKNSENLRAAIMSLWETLKEAGATVAAPFVKAFKMIADEVTKLLNKMVGSDAQNMASFWQTIGDKIAVGVNKISGAIKPVAEAIANVVSAFVEWEGFLPVIAGLTAAFVTYKATVMGVAAAVKAWNLIQKASVATMALMRGAMIAYTLAGGGLQGILAVVTAAQRALNLSMMMNPIGLIIAAIVGLGVAFVVAYKKSETFRAFVDKLFAAFKTGASAVWSFIKKYWPEILATITGPIGLAVYAVVKYWDQLKSATITAFNAVIGFFKQWGPLLLAALGGPIGLAVYAVVKHWDTIKNATITAFNTVKKFISDVVNGIKLITHIVISAMVADVKNQWNQFKTMTITVFNAIKGFFIAVWNGIKTAVVAIVTAYVNQVKQNWNLLKSVTTTVFNAVKSFLIAVWNAIKSTISKVVSALVNYVKGQWNALKSMTTSVFNAVKSFLTSVWNAIKTTVQKAANDVFNRVKTAWNNIKNTTTSIFNAVKSFLTGVWNGIKNTVSKLANSAKDGVVNAWNTLKNRTTEMFNNIKSKVTSIFDDIVSAAKKLPGRIGDGIKSMASGVKKGVKSFANTLVKAMGKGLNGTIDGVNWVLERVGAPKIKKWEVPEYAKGTKGHPGGLAILGDGGEHELYRTPKGQVGLSPNTDTLMNLPKGTEVLSGKQTKQAMSAIPMYNKGTDKLADGAKAVGGWIKDKGTQAVEKGKEVAGAAKDLALDVWDYASDPAGLMKKVFAKFIPDLPKLKGAAVDMLKGGVKKAKDSSIDFIKSKLDEYMSFSDGGGGSYTGIGGYYLNNPFRITTRFTPGGNPNDKVHKGGVHKGLDLAAPQGTAIKSLTDGIVKQVLIGSSTAGNGVRIQSGSDLLSYIHMMSAPSVKQGQKVKEGQVIGRVGSTGFSTGPHLDLKIKRNGSYINPLTYLQGKAGGGGGATGGNYAGKYASIIRAAAARFGVSPALVAGIIKQESKFNPNARSPVGATGLMQLMPATSRSMGVKNPRDPQQNIMGGTKYISQMLRMFHNDTALGLAAYNAGPGNVKKYGGIPPFRETQNYVRIVMANARGYGAQFKGYYKGARVAGKQLAWIAEKGAEYVIPTDGGQRAYDLWQQAGLENNFIGGGTSNSTAYNGPLVQIEYHGTGSKADAQEFINDVMPIVEKRLIKKIQTDSYKRGMKKG